MKYTVEQVLEMNDVARTDFLMEQTPEVLQHFISKKTIDDIANMTKEELSQIVKRLVKLMPDWIWQEKLIAVGYQSND